jgi:hypothetical protein
VKEGWCSELYSGSEDDSFIFIQAVLVAQEYIVAAVVDKK